MGKVLKSARTWTYLLVWLAVLLGLIYWLIGGRLDRLLFEQASSGLLAPFLAVGLVLFLLWSALPKWRRVERPEGIFWSANLPSRIGSYLQAIVWPLITLPSPDLVPEWLANHDYSRIAGMAALIGYTLWIIWKGLRQTAAEKASVKVSAAGLQVLRETFAWSEIQAVESGHAELEGGADIVLADRKIRLTPDKHGPTGRALVSAVQRFSPRTEIREPQFQARFDAVLEPA